VNTGPRIAGLEEATRVALRRYYERERLCAEDVRTGDVEEFDPNTGRFRTVMSAGGIRISDRRGFVR
jgi:hypothetical protein